MIESRPIIFALGLLLCILAALMALPAAVDLIDGSNNWLVFFSSSVSTFFVGGLLVMIGYDDKPSRFGIRQGFLLTTIVWFLLPCFAAIPLMGLGLTFTDSYFEVASGLTTTGATVLVGLDHLPRGILLWRALLSGIGGLGIVVMAIILLPFLRVGGMQLFQTESSDRSEKILPRATELVTATAGVFLGLIVMAAVTYATLGMDLFDAICHAFATIATAGFSTHDESFAFFKSPAIEWATTFFMICGALPFVVFISAARGHPAAIWNDGQVRTFVSFLVTVWLIVAAWLMIERSIPLDTALRLAAFNTTSIITTTGFVSDDYQKWGSFAFGLFLLLTFVGGCSGSTTGAIKIYRFQIAALVTRSHLMHLISPNRVVALSYGGRRIPPDVTFSVIAFLAAYLATAGIFTFILTGMGLDLITAFSATAACLGNVGPGLGEIVGPAGNFSSLPSAAKLVLSAAMIIGRLEIFTVFVLLMPAFWRN